MASIPHSSTFIPEHYRHLYTPEHLSRLRNTDWYLQSLYNFLPQIGVTVIQVEFSRYVIDVNRPLTQPLTGRYNKSAIYTSDTWHDPILVNRENDLHTSKRMNDYYHPYHHALENLITETKNKFGHAHLLDLHSFAGSIDESICLGSRDNNQTAPTLHPQMHSALERTFSSIAQNKVYRGGFITQKYGKMIDVEALQIELKYSEYLKEGTYEGDNFPEIDPLKFAHTKKKAQTSLS